jgi:hypothetical protein
VSNDSHSFNATWNWWKNDHSVHSFPHAQLKSELLPVQLSHLSSLQIAANWTTNLTDDLSSASSASSASSSSSSSHDRANWAPDGDSTNTIKADVALDLFLDPNPQRANVTKLPIYEIMIWFTAVPDVTPIGWSKPMADRHSYTLNNTIL